MLEVFDKIKESISKLQDGINELTGFKTVIESVKQVYNFFDTFFTIIPPEVFLLFIFCAFFLILINNISPTTPRLNITIAVFIFCGVWMFFNKTFAGEYKLSKVLYASLFILIPAYAIEIGKFAYRLLMRNRKIDTVDKLIPAIKEINLQYYEFLNAQTDFTKNPAAFITSVKKLKQSVSDLESKIL